MRVSYLEKASSYEELLKKANLDTFIKRKKFEGHVISDVQGLASNGARLL